MRRLYNGVGQRHPVTTPSVLFIPLSMLQVCKLQHQTSAQYSDIAYTRAKAVVQNTMSMALHPDLASHLIRTKHEVIILLLESRCW